MFDVSTTSKLVGFLMRSMAHESTRRGEARRRVALRDFGDHVAPESRGLEHVGLVDRRDQLSPGPRESKATTAMRRISFSS